MEDKINQEGQLNEEFLQMQKLAGIINEEEYNYQKTQLWYKNYAEGVRKSLNNLKNTMKDEGYNI
jgi:hypothetical protein